MIIGICVSNQDVSQLLHSTLVKMNHTVQIIETAESVHSKKLDLCIIESDSPFRCVTPIVWITELDTPWFVTRKFPFSIYGFCESLECGRADSDSKFVGVHIDSQLRRVFVDGVEIHLSRNEYGVLSYIKSCDGAIVSRMTLLEEVWGMDSSSGTRSVDVAITRIRNKLGVNRAGHIQTVSGEGYCWRAKL